MTLPHVVWGMLAVVLAPSAWGGFSIGLTLHGVGQGTFDNGTLSCEGVTFLLEAAYSPLEPRGGLHSEFSGACVVGGTVMLLGASVDSAEGLGVHVRLPCDGTRTMGLHCLHVTGEQVLEAFLAPYPGAGSRMAFNVTSPFRFNGSFVAL